MRNDDRPSDIELWRSVEVWECIVTKRWVWWVYQWKPRTCIGAICSARNSRVLEPWNQIWCFRQTFYGVLWGESFLNFRHPLTFAVHCFSMGSCVGYIYSSVPLSLQNRVQRVLKPCPLPLWQVFWDMECKAPVWETLTAHLSFATPHTIHFDTLKILKNFDATC